MDLEGETVIPAEYQAAERFDRKRRRGDRA